MYNIEQRDEQLLHTSAAIRYHIHFEEAARHLVRVVMEIDAPGNGLSLGLPVWTPGSYKVRDFSSHMGNPVVTDEKGTPIAWEWTSKNTVRIASANEISLRVEYLYYACERTVRTSHVNRFHAFLNFSNCLLYVENRQEEIHHVVLHHNRKQWKAVSTSLSPVQNSTANDQPIVLGALNYDILADSPVEIGNHYTTQFTACGAQHDIAIAGYGSFDTEWITERIKTIVETEAGLFGGLPYDRYVFILQMYPNMRGGLEHARSSVNMWDNNLAADKEKTMQFLSLLCHEFFHTWNVKRIRPRELGPFQYQTENYTRMLWLAEGLTSYYDDLLTYRCGFYTRDEYITIIGKEHISTLDDVPGRLAMAVKDSSYLAWTKLYVPTADSHNRFPSYYLKGGVAFLLFDLFIIAQSGGTKKLDDVLHALWALYQERPDTGVSEEEFLELVHKATGVDIRAVFHAWLGGTEELPYNDIFAPLGLQWNNKPAANPTTFGTDIPFLDTPSVLYTGLKAKDDNGKIIISSVSDGSPAAQAGIGVEDEIVAVDDRRIASAKDLNAEIALCSPGTSLSLLLSCDGTLYQTTLLPVQKDEHVLSIQENATEQQKTLLEFWLKR